MDPTRSPPKLKETPTTKPELLQEWRHLYEELRTLYPKSRALEIIGKRYGVSRQTVMYHMFPGYKIEKIKRDSRQWYFQKQDPVVRRRITDYKAKYMAARRHIGDLVTESYRRAGPRETMTYENLRDAIFEISGIAFHPSTLDGLIKCEATKRHPFLIDAVGGYHVCHYRLSQR